MPAGYPLANTFPCWTRWWVGTKCNESPSFSIWLPLPFTGMLKGTPQWGAADAEIKVPSGENTELTHSPFKALSRSVYSHTYYAYCQGFLLYFYPFPSIHLHLFQNLSRFFLCWLWLTHGSRVSPQSKIGHPAGGRFPC